MRVTSERPPAPAMTVHRYTKHFWGEPRYVNYNRSFVNILLSKSWCKPLLACKWEFQLYVSIELADCSINWLGSQTVWTVIFQCAADSRYSCQISWYRYDTIWLQVRWKPSIFQKNKEIILSHIQMVDREIITKLSETHYRDKHIRSNNSKGRKKIKQTMCIFTRWTMTS